ncbi:MAG: hypothetical protein U0163_07870 [Gemmatimonadaceae bacterium]
MTSIERQVRWLRMYAVGSSAVLLILVASAFAPRRFPTIDVERINVRNADGSLALALAGRGRLPAPMLDGKSFPASLSEGRTTTAGMIFFNESGDEVGGMIWGGHKTPGGYEAGEHLSFDQWKNDQVVTIDYLDDGKSSRSGLGIIDRPRDLPLSEVIALTSALDSATGARHDSLQRRVDSLDAAGKFGRSRIFLGSENRVATLRMKDMQGHERIRMVVDTANVARLEFLDEKGAVIARYPR